MLWFFSFFLFFFGFETAAGAILELQNRLHRLFAYTKIFCDEMTLKMHFHFSLISLTIQL
jgi:hypothetical protein